MNFRFKKIPERVQLISPDKNVIFASQILLAFKKTPLFSMKWRDQKIESKMDPICTLFGPLRVVRFPLFDF